MSETNKLVVYCTAIVTKLSQIVFVDSLKYIPGAFYWLQLLWEAQDFVQPPINIKTPPK